MQSMLTPTFKYRGFRTGFESPQTSHSTASLQSDCIITFFEQILQRDQAKGSWTSVSGTMLFQLESAREFEPRPTTATFAPVAIGPVQRH